LQTAPVSGQSQRVYDAIEPLFRSALKEQVSKKAAGLFSNTNSDTYALTISLPAAIDVPGLRYLQSVCQNSAVQGLSGVDIHIDAGEAGIAKALLGRIEFSSILFEGQDSCRCEQL
jgi:hypothetical protein